MSSRTDHIRKSIDTLVKDQVVSGISYAFLNKDHEALFYCGKQGFIEPYCKRSLEPGMYYDLASLSKVIGTTTRMIQLFDQGVVYPDTKAADILPRFQHPAITLEQLLMHNSGLPAEIRDKQKWNRETIIDSLYTTGPIARPGGTFCYSDVGFILLGQVIETVDQMGLEESYQQHIFRPLGMQQTSFITKSDHKLYIPTEVTKERGCICQTVHDKKAHLIGPCGSAGLFSTLEDVCIFVKAYLNHSPQLFTERWFDRLEDHELFGRTLGWSKEYGSHILYHTGFTGTSILIDLQHEEAFVMLANRIHPTRDNDKFLIARKNLNHIFLGK